MLLARCGTASLVRARRGMAVQFGRDQAGSGTAGRGGCVPVGYVTVRPGKVRSGKAVMAL